MQELINYRTIFRLVSSKNSKFFCRLGASATVNQWPKDCSRPQKLQTFHVIHRCKKHDAFYQARRLFVRR